MAEPEGRGTLRSAPVADPDSQPFWQALREHRIVLQECARCEEVRFPPMPGCPHCGSPASAPVDAQGSGTVYSCIVVHRPMGSFAESELPAAIATVELAEGCRVLGRVLLEVDERAAGSALIGQPVSACFVDHEDWTELAFALVTPS